MRGSAAAEMPGPVSRTVSTQPAPSARAVTSTRRSELDWLYRGAGRFFPEAWERFRDGVPESERERVTAAEGANELLKAYVRLLDSTDEFTAEVVTSPEGEFRFFAAPGEWKLRSLAPVGRGERVLTADVGLNETTVAIG